MKILRLLAVIVAALCLLASCASLSAVQPSPLPEEIELLFFHETECGTCDGTAEFDALLREHSGGVTGRYPYVVQEYNVFETDGRAKLEAATELIGIPRENLSFPLLIVNSKVFVGMEAIAENFEEAFLTAGEDIFVNKSVWLPSDGKTMFEGVEIQKGHATAVYFYRITCPECNEIKPLIDSLPKEINADGETAPLDLIRFNTRSGNNNERIQAFFTAYEVPPEKQQVPIVFLRDTYLSGYEEISASLQTLLEEGEAENFRLP